VTSTVNDADDDEIPDPFDNCPEVSNELQEDRDEDGTGDRCDPSNACIPEKSIPSVRCRVIALADRTREVAAGASNLAGLLRHMAVAHEALLNAGRSGAAGNRAIEKAMQRLRAFGQRLRSPGIRRQISADRRTALLEDVETIRSDLAAVRASRSGRRRP
jgi:hypothetical protein